MPEVIFKYTVAFGETTVRMPHDAEVIAFQLQRGVPTIWTKHDRSQEEFAPEERTFLLVGTGHDIDVAPDEHLKHIGTVQNGSFVWHLFEIEFLDGR